MEWLTLLAVLLSPVIPVLISLWLQRRKERRDRKNHIFATLMMHRRTFPPAPDWVNALNLIDIVFFDSPKVLGLWHQYYRLLGSSPQTENDYKDRDHKYLEMLSSMASELGYRNLQQIDIDKFYTPKAFNDQSALSNQIQNELLRFLQSVGSLAISQSAATNSDDKKQ